jgi:two-component system, NarL family, nitrate/nitrite sensor histidine kinase NarX
LHNTVKHARASKAELKLKREAGGAIALQVSDGGVGFDPGDDFSGHLGLKSMGEWRDGWGVRFKLRARPGRAPASACESRLARKPTVYISAEDYPGQNPAYACYQGRSCYALGPYSHVLPTLQGEAAVKMDSVLS